MYDSETSYLYCLQWHPNQKWITLSVIETNNPKTIIKSVIFKTNYVHKDTQVYEVAKRILNISKEKFVTLDATNRNISYEMGQPDMLINYWRVEILKK